MTPNSAVTGGAAVLSFVVPEGCAGSPTRSLEISIPAEIDTVKPQPKAGWTIALTQEPLPKPIEDHGVVQKDRVSKIKWTGGPLADSHFEQFVLIVRVPAKVGKLYFPAVQTCEQGELRWTKVPGETPPLKAQPAPALTVIAKS